MNPRLLCRDRTFHKALLLTYTFDPLFFERLVLPDLWAGRTGDILVISDRHQAEAALQVPPGALWHLGKSYLLSCANHDGAFHPKVLLRLGPKDGLVMVGSSNLTNAGWGGNRELGTSWRVGPDHPDTGAWLPAFLDDAMTWCDGTLERDAVRRMQDVPWLSLTPPAMTASPLLYSRRERALSGQLAARWAGRRFESVRILTGSTDASGAFLRWAHATFGIQRAVIALTPSMASFDPAQLADLPIELRLIAAPPDKPLHAKFYWFEGASGPAAIMGSANCSAAAWLLSPADGGNVETVVVYDQPTADAFASALSLFARPDAAPSDLLPAPGPLPAAAPHTPVAFRLRGLRWEQVLLQVQAVIEPPPAPSTAVALLLGERSLAMQAAPEGGGEWVCVLPEGIAEKTTFASVRVLANDASWTLGPRWIDDLSALQHASQAARLIEPFKGLERSATAAEQRQMLEDLQEVARALFHDGGAFRDPGHRPSSAATDEPAPNAAPVDPHDLVRDLDARAPALARGAETRGGALSLSGILRLLFDAGGGAADVDDSDDGETDDDDPNANEGRGADAKPSHNPDPPPIEARMRERLASQMRTFLTELRSAGFAERCSATQMVQAICFPLAVALRGRKRGWVSPDDAEHWALDVLSALFPGASPNARGLLETLQQRYALNGQSAIFDAVVGDGTLWVLLVSTLGGAAWKGPGTDLDKALALREVFSSPYLLSTARADRIADLIRSVRIEGAQQYVAEVAPTVTRVLNQIEAQLRPIWAAEAQAQANRHFTHKVGDLLWRENVGWAVCLEDNALDNDLPTRVRLKGLETKVKSGYYVDVTDLAERDAGLQRSLNELRARIA